MEVATHSLPPLPCSYDSTRSSSQRSWPRSWSCTTASTTKLTSPTSNTALNSQVAALKNNDTPTQIANQQAITFNRRGHINHSLFWPNLAPSTSSSANPFSAPKLSTQVTTQYGSVDCLKENFNKSLLGIQGSWWGWLVKKNDTGMLAIVTTKDQDLVPATTTPVFGADVWEHAYHLQYLNGKAKYVENIWTVINWQTAEGRFAGGREYAFRVLKASI